MGNAMAGSRQRVGEAVGACGGEVARRRSGDQTDTLGSKKEREKRAGKSLTA
jgi:hypothetical protein